MLGHNHLFFQGRLWSEHTPPSLSEATEEPRAAQPTVLSPHRHCADSLTWLVILLDTVLITYLRLPGTGSQPPVRCLKKLPVRNGDARIGQTEGPSNGAPPLLAYTQAVHYQTVQHTTEESLGYCQSSICSHKWAASSGMLPCYCR